jgi:dTDP-4-amino-4,6-dideoxy-D-galactose acyltransferase
VTPCEFLQWDSEFFGVRVARLNGNLLTPELLAASENWCRAEAIDCLYFLAAADDAQTVALASDFRFTDVQLRFERKLEQVVSASTDVRPCRPGDLPELRAIAACSHRDSRFYYDGRFPPEKCDELFETWITRSAEGWADAVFTGVIDGVPAGYITCHIAGEDGSIGLTAVGEHARGRGLGGALVNAALGYFVSRGAKRALVVTQGRNIQSQRMYQKAGFITGSVRLWFHRWFKPETLKSAVHPLYIPGTAP